MYKKRTQCLIGEKVILVPYSPHHVERYHKWMLDPLLRSQTASEPLTIEQEYEMQQTWMADDNKTTFIVLSEQAYTATGSELGSMVGDVNLFLTAEEDHDGIAAEVEVMIAELCHRRSGLGEEATKLIMAHGVADLGVTKFRAKVGTSNVASLSLFQVKLGFKEISKSDVFEEVTSELVVDPNTTKHFCTIMQQHRWIKYTELKCDGIQ